MYCIGDHNGAPPIYSGVHSKGQVAHFKINKNFPLEKIIGALNQHLKPLPIAVLNVQEVDENFHARFSAKLRSYKYFIINRKVPLTINRNHAWCVFKKLNIARVTKNASGISTIALLDESIKTPGKIKISDATNAIQESLYKYSAN